MPMVQLAKDCFVATQHVVVVAPASLGSPLAGKVVVSFVNGETRWVEPSDGQTVEDLSLQIAKRVHEAEQLDKVPHD